MNELYSDEGSLRSYYACPKGLLRLGLGDTDKCVYLLLLDRARLSGRSGDGWRDEQGRVFLIYPIAALARDLGCGESAVRSSLRELEEKDLIRRRRQGLGRPNRLYVKLPPEPQKSGAPDRQGSGGHDCRESGALTAGFAAPNKKERNKKRDIKGSQSAFYSYGIKTSPSAGPTLEEYERMRRSLERMQGHS